MRSCNEKVFNEEKEVYQDALRKSGYDFEMKYDSTAREKDPSEKKKKRNKPTCWFNPPWSDNVKTPVGKVFLSIVSSCFPKENPLKASGLPTCRPLQKSHWHTNLQFLAYWPEKGRV